MELAKWMKTNVDELPLLGIESFKTFLKISSIFSKWALDDISLSIKTDKYKIWTCPVKSTDITKIKGVLERYSSMKKLLKYYNDSIVENKNISFFMSLNYINNNWNFEYGINNGDKLYVIGEFNYTLNTKLPESELIKYVSSELEDFNSREHLLLYKLRKDMTCFNPGYCQITEPIIMDKTIIMTVYNLGIWNDNDILETGEKEKYLDIFKSWCLDYKWSSLVTIIVRPKIKKSIDFIIKLK